MSSDEDDLLSRCSTIRLLSPWLTSFRCFLQVVNQFREQCSSVAPSTLEDTYVMGHRLIAFLSLTLPQHPEYLQVNVSPHRNKTFRDLVWINEQMDDLAVKIDEQELNRYISLEYDPNPVDLEDEEDDEQSTHSSNQRKTIWSLSELDQGSWESFPNWNLFGTSELSSDLPNVTDTDTSSFDNELNNTRETCSDSEREEPTAFVALPTTFQPLSVENGRKTKKRVQFQLDPEAELAVNPHPKASLLVSQLEVESNDADEPAIASGGSEVDDYCGEPDLIDNDYDTRYVMHDALQVSEFLRKIAEEDVNYEIDSDANDSWAQDAAGEDEEEPVSESREFGSGAALTCDPARLAFPQLLHTVSSRVSLPKNTEYVSTQTESGDYWASFDFASVRQKLV